MSILIKKSILMDENEYLNRKYESKYISAKWGIVIVKS